MTKKPYFPDLTVPVNRTVGKGYFHLLQNENPIFLIDSSNNLLGETTMHDASSSIVEGGRVELSFGIVIKQSGKPDYLLIYDLNNDSIFAEGKVGANEPIKAPAHVWPGQFVFFKLYLVL